jgi:hypothetical protein
MALLLYETDNTQVVLVQRELELVSCRVLPK